MTSLNKAIWVVSEGGSYATDPGSGYLGIPANTISELKAIRTPLATSYQTNRGLKTRNIPGPMAWSFEFECLLEGLSDSAEDAASVPTADYLDTILTHIAGNSETRDGEGLSGAPGSATALSLDTDVGTVQQLVPIWEAALPATADPRTQWQLITVDNSDGTYTVAPGISAYASYSNAADAYGIRAFYQTVAGDSGNSLMFIFDDDGTEYELLGGRVTACSIEMEVGEPIRIRFSVAGDRWATSSNGLTPADGPAITPSVGTVSPVYFNGTEVEVRSVSIDLGIRANERKATSGTHGRAGFDNIALSPMVTVEALRTGNTYKAIQAAGTVGRLLVQLGGGVLANSALGSLAFHAEAAQLEDQDRTDDDGRTRQTLTFAVIDGGEFSSGVNARFWQIARA